MINQQKQLVAKKKVAENRFEYENQRKQKIGFTKPKPLTKREKKKSRNHT